MPETALRPAAQARRAPENKAFIRSCQFPFAKPQMNVGNVNVCNGNHQQAYLQPHGGGPGVMRFRQTSLEEYDRGKNERGRKQPADSVHQAIGIYPCPRSHLREWFKINHRTQEADSQPL